MGMPYKHAIFISSRSCLYHATIRIKVIILRSTKPRSMGNLLLGVHGSVQWRILVEVESSICSVTTRTFCGMAAFGGEGGLDLIFSLSPFMGVGDCNLFLRRACAFGTFLLVWGKDVSQSVICNSCLVNLCTFSFCCVVHVRQMHPRRSLSFSV